MIEFDVGDGLPSTLIHMTATATRPPSSTFTASLGNAKVERLADGTAMVRGLKIFRTGKFRDSKQRQAEWTQESLAKLVANFATLRDSQIFPHVPVRTNHGRDVNNVIGYFEGLSIEDRWLVADLHITEPSAVDKIERKTYRSRSLEVGPYVDNDDNVHNPTVLGLAFVDIGAVEGLFNSPDSPEPSYFTITENEMPTFEQSQLDWAVAAAYAKGLEDAPKPDLAPFEFTYGGQKSSDPKVVQAYIQTLETAAAEQRDVSRKNFVTSLATNKKIPATQIEAAQALVLTMSDEQYAAYVKMYEAAPSVPLFDAHTGDGDGSTDNNGGENAAEVERSIAEETIAMHRRAGMSEDQIKETASYQKLLALNGTK